MTYATESKPSEQYHTLAAVASSLSVDVKTVRRMIKPTRKGPPALKAVNISQGTERCIWRVAQSEIDKFIANRNK